MSSLFLIDDTPNTLRLKWLRAGLRVPGPAALEKYQRCHIPMIELLGSLRSVILDVGDQSLHDLKGIKDRATLILEWHWADECDGIHEAQLEAGSC